MASRATERMSVGETWWFSSSPRLGVPQNEYWMAVENVTPVRDFRDPRSLGLLVVVVEDVLDAELVGQRRVEQRQSISQTKSS